MAKMLNLYEAKTSFSRLVDEAAAGEEIVICKHGKPKVRLVRVAAEGVEKPREPGFWRGKVWLAEDWEAPLPEEIFDVFRDDPHDPLNEPPQSPDAGSAR